MRKQTKLSWIVLVLAVQLDLIGGKRHYVSDLSSNYCSISMNQRQCRFYSRTVNCRHFRKPRLSMINRRATRINISESNVQQLYPWAMRKFKYLQCLDASNNNIRSLRNSFLHNSMLTWLDLSHNRLGSGRGYSKELKRVFYANKKLATLDISHNNIAHLSGLMLSRKNNLKNLDASWNQITRVRKNSLRTFVHLERLNLQENGIIFIHKQAFARNRKLVYLNLNKNRISFLGRNRPLKLTRNKNLQELLISDNKLNSANDIDFAINHKLKALELSFNIIMNVGNINGQFNLLYLNLSYNHIKKIDWQSFQNLTNLQTLDLSANELFVIDKKMIASLNQLKVLILSYNHISTIPSGLFTDNMELEELDLRGNELTQTQRQLLQREMHLTKIYLK